jgi:hypothetical protein
MPREKKPVVVKPAREPVAFKPRPQTLRDIVRKLAADTDNISWFWSCARAHG